MLPGASQPPAVLMKRLEDRYGEPHRHYHTWTHIEALLQHLREQRLLIHAPTPVLWATLWHDAIYDPRRNDNEEVSAQLLEQEGGAHLSADDLTFAGSIVRATASHQIPDGLPAERRSDCGVFLDLDLSILAAPASAFDAYEGDIRCEYAFVAESVFRAVRASILSRLLKRSQIYFTPALRDRWEARARTNLQRSVARLRTPIENGSADR